MSLMHSVTSSVPSTITANHCHYIASQWDALARAAKEHQWHEDWGVQEEFGKASTSLRRMKDEGGSSLYERQQPGGVPCSDGCAQTCLPQFRHPG